MKTPIVPLVTLSLFSSGIFSCMPEPLPVDDVPVARAQIVVSSQMAPGGLLVIALTKTFGALDINEDSDPEEVLEQLAVSDAIVTLRSQQEIDTLTQIANGVYSASGIDLHPGETYSLHVKSASMGEVTATSTVMEAVVFDSVAAMLTTHGNSDWPQITYSANDLSGENCYLLTVQKIQRTTFPGNILKTGAFTHITNDEAFDDKLFTEQFNVVSENYKAGDTIAVAIANVSEEYYDFLKLRLDNSRSIIEYLDEPVNYPSNVVGGEGFFNLYVPDVELLILSD